MRPGPGPSDSTPIVQPIFNLGSSHIIGGAARVTPQDYNQKIPGSLTEFPTIVAIYQLPSGNLT